MSLPSRFRSIAWTLCTASAAALTMITPAQAQTTRAPLIDEALRAAKTAQQNGFSPWTHLFSTGETRVVTDNSVFIASLKETNEGITALLGSCHFGDYMLVKSNRDTFTGKNSLAATCVRMKIDAPSFAYPLDGESYYPSGQTTMGLGLKGDTACLSRKIGLNTWPSSLPKKCSNHEAKGVIGLNNATTYFLAEPRFPVADPTVIWSQVPKLVVQ